MVNPDIGEYLGGRVGVHLLPRGIQGPSLCERLSVVWIHGPAQSTRLLCLYCGGRSGDPGFEVRPDAWIAEMAAKSWSGK